MSDTPRERRPAGSSRNRIAAPRTPNSEQRQKAETSHAETRSSARKSPSASAREERLKLFIPEPDKNYLVFCKPFGVLTQFTSPEEKDQRTLAEFGLPPEVYPVGRLDQDSEGLIVLTDDTRLNQALLLPEFAHDRTYLVQIENVPTDEQLDSLQTGVMVEKVKTRAASAQLVEGEPVLPQRDVPIRFRKSVPTSWITLTIREGKNRQVRRMTAAVGCPTLRLMRIAIGKLNLFKLGLKPGDWVSLDAAQIALLFERADSDLKIPMEPKS